MQFIKSFFNHWVLFLTVLLIAFCASYFVTEKVYNYHNTCYEVKVTSEIIKKEDIDASFFTQALAKYQDGVIVGYSYDSVKPEAFFQNHDITIYDDLTISIKGSYFTSNAGFIGQDSLNRYDKFMRKVITYYDANAVITPTRIINYHNGFLIGAIALIATLIIYILFFAVMYAKGYLIKEDNIYNNENFFKYPFSISYWKTAFKSITKIRAFDLCLIAILFALQMCCKLISIPSGFLTLGIGITYLIFSLICLLYGPLWGLIIGMCSDILGFFLFPSSGGFGFDFLYTIQAMLAGFVYGIFFYKTDITFTKCFFARLIINLIINALYGSFLYAFHLMGTGLEGMIVYLLTLSLPKNLIYLLPQSILLYFFFRMVLPLFINRNMIHKNTIRHYKGLERNE